MNELQRIAESSPNLIDVTPRTTAIEMPGSGPKREYAGLLEYWQIVRRHKGAVILATCLGAIGGFGSTLSSERVYQARTTLEIQGLNDEFLNMKSVNPVADGANLDIDKDIQTQVRILQSRGLLTRVRDKLQQRPRPDHLEPPDRLGVWRKALKMDPPTPDELWSQALGTAMGGVRVRTSGTNRIVEVSCESINGQIAADFCNSLTQEFIDQNLESRWKTTEYTGDWLTKQLQDLKIKLEHQQQELQEYVRATGLVLTNAATALPVASGKNESDGQSSRLGSLQNELATAQADRIAKQSKYEMAQSSPPEALADVLDDSALKASRQQLTDLKARLAQLRVTFTPSAKEVKQVQAQIDAIEASLGAARENAMTRIRAEYDASTRREALLVGAYTSEARTLSGQAEQTAHYNLLKSDVEATRLLYDNLQQRLKEASIASALRANNIRVVDSAETPSVPYKPDVRQQCTFGLLMGIVVGVVFSVIRERADRTLQDPGDVSYYLGMPELGVVPVGELMNLPRSKAGATALATTASIAADTRRGSVELISWSQKTSLLAESFRTTLTSILFSAPGGEQPRVLVLTSASPKEGKTTVVSNLSITMAEINKRVLVIDADMRRPRLHHVFKVENKEGLSNLLVQKTALDADALESGCTPTEVPGLWILPSGSSRAHASSLVHSARLSELIALAREQFDMVIIDTPPMVNIADARVLARLGDAVILVVRSGATTRDAAQLAKTRFAEDGTTILGTILNCWNPQTPGYSYYKYYYAGYYHYYGNGNGNGGGNDPNGGGSRPGGSDGTLDTDADQPAIPSPWKPGFVFRRQLGDGPATQ